MEFFDLWEKSLQKVCFFGNIRYISRIHFEY